MEMDLFLLLQFVVVEIFTTDGINFSAKSAKEAGASLALPLNKLNLKI